MYINLKFITETLIKRKYHAIKSETNLRAQIFHLDWFCVVNSDGLDSAEHHVFGDFNTEAGHAAHEHVRRSHALHRFVAQHVPSMTMLF